MSFVAVFKRFMHYAPQRGSVAAATWLRVLRPHLSCSWSSVKYGRLLLVVVLLQTVCPLGVVFAAMAPAAPANWLAALGTNAANRRKAAATSVRPTAGQGAEQQGGEATPKPKFTVLYRFNEGYTNAVKRPLTMGELLQ